MPTYPLGKFPDISWHMILPTLLLVITSFAGLQRITRGELLMYYARLHPNRSVPKDFQKTVDLCSCLRSRC